MAFSCGGSSSFGGEEHPAPLHAGGRRSYTLDFLAVRGGVAFLGIPTSSVRRPVSHGPRGRCRGTLYTSDDRRNLRTNPESLSPGVRSVVLQLATGLSYAQQQALRLSNRILVGRERFLANPSTVQGSLAFLGSLMNPWSPVTLVTQGVPQETEGPTATPTPPTEASLVGEAVRQEAGASDSPSLSLNDAFLHED